GEEPGLTDPEQETGEVELGDRTGEPHQHGDDAPAHEDPSDPDPGADPVEQEVARNLEQAVAEEEDADEESERLARDPELAVHRERREADVDPIEKRNDVQREEHRQEPGSNEANRLWGDLDGRCGADRRLAQSRGRVFRGALPQFAGQSGGHVPGERWRAMNSGSSDARYVSMAARVALWARSSNTTLSNVSRPVCQV